MATAEDMFRAVSERAEAMDWIIKAAAVADYTPTEVAENKIKKKDGDLSIPLKRTQDILGWLGQHRKPGQLLAGFSMESENMLANSKAKLTKKNVDMICANDLRQAGAGFQVDTNVLTLITHEDIRELPLLSKEEAALAVLDRLKELEE